MWCRAPEEGGSNGEGSVAPGPVPVVKWWRQEPVKILQNRGDVVLRVVVGEQTSSRILDISENNEHFTVMCMFNINIFTSTC